MKNIETKQTDAEVKKQDREQGLNNVAVWTSFYRANPHRFARDYLGLKLKKFQQIILNEMFRKVNSIYLASRGIGKTFLLAIFCVCYCILFPGTIICIASRTKVQAAEVINKIINILMPKSPNLRQEIQNAHVGNNDAVVVFKNGSIIQIVTATDSARHNRATILIIDEYRLVDRTIINTVLRKFLTSQRHPDFLDKPEYANYPRERTKELYASSCWYEGHWSYDLVKTYVVNMMRGRSYYCCSMPYQIAIKEQLLDRERIEDEMSESDFNEVTFQMEMCALFWSIKKNGLYSFDEIDGSRTLKYPFYPSSMAAKLNDKKMKLPPKRDGEIRILSADIALMSSNKTNNDATAIFLNQMLPTSSGSYIYNIVYTENNEGLRADDQALNIRRLYEEFECDYLVIDSTGLGLPVVDLLMSDMYDQSLGKTYGAISCCNNDEIAQRCTSPNAPKTIWAIRGSSDFNSRCALNLRELFRQNKIKLLLSEYTAEDVLSELKGYNSLSPEDQLTLKLPYINTTLLVNELINLKCETKNGIVKVSEEAGARKDRYCSLGYNVLIAKQIERDLDSMAKSSVDNIIFNFKAPKISRFKNHRGGM